MCTECESGVPLSQSCVLRLSATSGRTAIRTPSPAETQISIESRKNIHSIWAQIVIFHQFNAFLWLTLGLIWPNVKRTIDNSLILNKTRFLELPTRHKTPLSASLFHYKQICNSHHPWDFKIQFTELQNSS